LNDDDEVSQWSVTEAAHRVCARGKARQGKAGRRRGGGGEASKTDLQGHELKQMKEEKEQRASLKHKRQ